MTDATFDAATRAVTSAAHVLVLTGAGISAASGVPTFRDAQTGLWAQYRAEDLATPEAFARNPVLVWQWYQWRRDLVRKAQPNAAHDALAQLAKLKVLSLVTQNVDDLHQRAGSDGVIALHGALFANHCLNGHHYAADTTGLEQPPQCPECESPIRPGVVWFGEQLPRLALQAADKAVQTAEVALVIGTSSLVWPAAGLAEAAIDRGIPVVEINPQPTPFSARATYHVRGAAEQILPALVRELQPC